MLPVISHLEVLKASGTVCLAMWWTLQCQVVFLRADFYEITYWFLSCFFFVIIECTTEDGMSCKIHPPKAWTFMNLCSLLILCANLESFRFPKGTTGISYKPLRLIWMLITQIIFSVEQCVHHVSVNAFLLMLNFLLIFAVVFLVSCIVTVVNC